MYLQRASPTKSQQKITLDDIFEWALYDTETWNTVSHFVSTATNSRVNVSAFVEFMKYNYGLYVLNSQTVNRLSAPFTPESFSESFTECFGTGAAFAPDLSEYYIYLVDEKHIQETIEREGEHGKEGERQNSGGVATASDFTTTATPSGTVTTQINGVLSETVNKSLGSWDNENLQGESQTVTSGTPSSTETVTDLKVITERTTGNTGSTTDTRKTETEETGTFSNSETRERTETGGTNDIIRKSILSMFARMFINVFCVTCYNID